MLRDIVGTFLDTLTEREFDGPLLALLASRGFTDIHFIHGGFEFGKDVLAKRADPKTGEVRQYAIQSKAGDLGQGEWRAVRPQLEESEYNPLGHPSFDTSLPRVAVLVTTGRLKGSAPTDVTEYRKSVAARGIADLEIWEKSDLVDWMCDDPVAGVAGEVQKDLLAMMTSILDKGVTERRIEAYTRRWLGPGESPRAAIEAAILINALTRGKRLDLAASVALQFFRAASEDEQAPVDLDEAARRLLVDLFTRMLDQVEPLLADPLDLARSTVSQISYLTYPVICCRLAEAAALGLALVRESDPSQAARFETALVSLAQQPGSARPPGDLFATSVVATTLLLGTFSRPAAKDYLGRVARWLLDRHDDDLAGLGLASLNEDEETTAARLLGGSLESTTLARRTSSYLTTAVMDLALFLGEADLYEALRDNLGALRIVPESTSADESVAHWSRGGANVWPQPRVDFEAWDVQAKVEPASVDRDPVEALLLTAACRSRHYPGRWLGSLAGKSSE